MTKTNPVWLHFVGKSYYTINQFIKEAQQIGVSRAVAPNVLRKMKFGDTILLAQKDGTSTKIFGYFVFNQITGLNSQIVNEIITAGAVQKAQSLVPMKIQRGCGSYEVVAQYQVINHKIVMEVIKQAIDDKLDIGRVMIGGIFHSLEHIGLHIGTDYVLCEIPFRQGFRLFEFRSFCDQYEQKFINQMGKGHVKVKGQFYCENEQTPLFTEKYWIDDAGLIEIENYKLN